MATTVTANNYSFRERKTKSRSFVGAEMADEDFDDDHDEGGASKGRSKSRRELPAGAVATLKAWLLSPEHFTHPYPTPQDQAMLMQKTGIDKKQLKNWFTNARRRIWKPMLKKQIEQGKLTAAGAGVPGLMIPTIPGAPGAAMNGTMDNPHSVQAMRVHYQQAMGTQPPGTAQGDNTFAMPAPYAPNSPQAGASPPNHPGNFYAEKGQSSQQMVPSSSIGTLPQMSSSTQLSKTDSHAVLMELFARDQDLVKQATESARLKAESKLSGQSSSGQQQGSSSGQQHPMKTPSQGLLTSVPTLSSWPHFSSITSLNNLGSMPGVKSITSLSGADLASKGAVNKMGNLAQVKSVESMGRNDSYAFLEVFFGDKSSGNLSGMVDSGKDAGSKGNRQSTEDDNEEIGLSLEDESPATQAPRKGFPTPAPLPAASSTTQESSMESGTLKRAYDDALAARGLIAVSRSCEKLTELPAKIQRTLSQDYINRQQAQAQQQMGQYSFQGGAAGVRPPGSSTITKNTSRQYPGEEPVEPSTGGEEDGHVQVPVATKCALCGQTNVDTQLRPCGHMFHERCLKPSLQTPMGPPCCPIDNIPMQSALLAVPTEENTKQNDQKQSGPTQSSWKAPEATRNPTTAVSKS